MQQLSVLWTHVTWSSVLAACTALRITDAKCCLACSSPTAGARLYCRLLVVTWSLRLCCLSTYCHLG